MSEIITFGSVCSGIEAASVAWHPLGWRAAWLSEIETNPSTILAHHYPDVPNLGDMTHIPQLLRNGDIPPPDVFCGGTPCQAFSVAGLRNSLDDARGNLSLKFCDIANEIDIQRAAAGLLPCTVFWENVPGVLSTKDNAFGCFLGQLAGEDCALVPPGDKWSDAGAVLGPQRAIAWRVLDAQFFGLAQRRKRVFVVASARNGFDPAAVLFEFEGVRRDTAPRREQGQDTAGTLASRTDGGGFPGTDEACSGYIQPVVSTLDASYGRMQGCAGQDANHGHSHLVPLAFGGNNQSGAIDVATACNAHSSASGRLDDESFTFKVQPAPIAFDSRQECVSSTEVFGALGSSSPQAQAVSYAIQAGALRTNPSSGPDGVGVQADVAYTLEARAEVQCVGFAAREIAQTITSNYGKQLDNSDTSLGPNVAIHGMAVRRLTPIECEKLQGFPPDYTLIPMPDRRSTRKEIDRRTEPRMMADGPRYKALGNSWAVPVVRWIGARVDAELRRLEGKR
jgi:DNA (cytosine-5)-methyltransferase 1